MHPLLRQHGPGTSRAGETSEAMLRFWFHHMLQPVGRAMEGLWVGFGDLAGRCPSVRDPARGGSIVTGHGAVTVRAMNEAQWVEILQAWMDWRFRPTYAQLLARLAVADDDADVDDEVRGAAAGLA